MRSSSPRSHRRNRLASCLAAALTLAAPLAQATSVVWTVNTCDQTSAGSVSTHSGSLRFVATYASSGDVADLTNLTCSSITLTTGAIEIAQQNLIINGPGQGKLTITGQNSGTLEHDRIFTHTGSGELNIKNLSIEYGDVLPASGSAVGGCIYSAGSVYLKGVDANHCYAGVADNSKAEGGAIYAKGSVYLHQSTLTNNSAYAGKNGSSFGGAIVAKNFLGVYYSGISGNSAYAYRGKSEGYGGAAYVPANIVIKDSTISSNYAGVNCGGIAPPGVRGSSNGFDTTITNSTISGNTAGNAIGGLCAYSKNVYLNNSTIAFNLAKIGSYKGNFFAPGLATNTTMGSSAVTMQSTLIADNTYGSPATEDDVSSVGSGFIFVGFFGANNLVHVAKNAALPSGTITSCPLLGPLRDNGGATKTHALLSHSPGIDQGNNALILSDDQRGYPFARVSNGTADIGAYEVQQSDVIFNNGFDSCP